MQTLGTALIGSFFIIAFLTVLLNKMGIIPIVGAKSLFKAFAILTLLD